MTAKERYRIEEIIELINASNANDPIAFEVGKALLLNTLESGREFCNTMIPVAVTAIGVYFGLLSWSWPRTANGLAPSIGTLELILILMPAVHLLVAVVAHAAGYFGVASIRREENLTIVGEYRNTCQIRISWVVFGAMMFWSGIAAGLAILIDLRTASNFMLAEPVISVLALLTAGIILQVLRRLFGIARGVFIALIVLITILIVVYVFLDLTGFLVGLLRLLSVAATLVLMVGLVFFLLVKVMLTV
jgi:hypothetical protein